jgi:NADH dehydrogenase FAD-containing subunit
MKHGMEIDKTEKKIVIIGGGYLGTRIARDFDKLAEVTLIERNPVFFHKISSLRAAIRPDWTKASFMPYGNLLKYGRIIHDSATGVNTKLKVVELAKGISIPYDILVIATGSDYEAPAKFQGKTVSEAILAMRQYQATIKIAKSILIIGAGPVGIELAGEIREIYPEKKITLINRSEQILKQFPQKFGKKVLQRLKEIDVTVIAGESHAKKQINNLYITGKGTGIQADLVISTTGAISNSAWLKHSQPSWLNEPGEIVVDKYFRVKDEKYIFAAGDAAATGDPKMSLMIERQFKTLKENILKTLDNAPLKAYKFVARSNMVFMPLGSKGGVSIIGPLLLGDFTTRLVKANNLLTAKYQKQLGIRT